MMRATNFLLLLYVLGSLLLSCNSIRYGDRRTMRPRSFVAKYEEDINTSLQVLSTTGTLRGGANAIPEGKAVSAFLNRVDLFGTAVFALSGAITAGKKGMDLYGMLIIATITAVGGGTMRSLLFGTGTVFWMEQPIYVEICTVVTLLTFFLWPKLEKNMGWQDSSLPICFSDAFGLSAFAVLGTQKAADLGLPPFMWVVSGVITATFGGITRDVMCLQRPRVMYPTRTLYAGPVILGSASYTILTNVFKVSTEIAAFVSFLLTLSSRTLAFGSSRRLPYWKNVKELEDL